ncbi:MAG: FGGY family carbohydrate kinase [Acidimicrobiales bacterium]
MVATGGTSMAETVVFFGSDASPATSSVVSHDTRGCEDAEEIARGLGHDTFTELTGLSISSMCTLAKLVWLHRHGAPRMCRGPQTSLTGCCTGSARLRCRLDG